MHFQPIDELNLLLGGGLVPAVSTPKAILDAINRYYPLEGTKKQMIEELAEEKTGEENVAFEAIGEKDILSMADEAPIIKLVNHILFQAAKRGASDIHIEPFEKEMVVRYRIDGVLYNVMNVWNVYKGPLFHVLKLWPHLILPKNVFHKMVVSK